MLFFYGEELLFPRSAPKLENHSLSAVHECLLSIFAGITFYTRVRRARVTKKPQVTDRLTFY